MLELEDIKNRTIWVVKYNNGHRITCLESEINYKDENVRDVDRAAWSAQPKDLQDFYKDYDFAVYRQNRRDLESIEDFYEEWIEDPLQFQPESRPVIGHLFEILETMRPDQSVVIRNYNKKPIGNHHVDCFIEALEILETDFDVVEFSDDRIIIQSDDLDLISNFDSKANKAAINRG